MSQLRAVETGRSVLQVATTGISAVIAPDGRITQRSGKLFTPDIIEGWDHVVGQDGPWLHATKVVGATSTATSAPAHSLAATHRLSPGSRHWADRTAANAT